VNGGVEPIDRDCAALLPCGMIFLLRFGGDFVFFESYWRKEK